MKPINNTVDPIGWGTIEGLRHDNMFTRILPRIILWRHSVNLNNHPVL